MTTKKRKKSKTTHRSTRRGKTVRVSKLPALSTLVKMPIRHLQSGIKRYEIALDAKQSPGMFSKGGKRLFIGPRGPSTTPQRRKGKSRRQRLPKEIAHLFP